MTATEPSPAKGRGRVPGLQTPSHNLIAVTRTPVANAFVSRETSVRAMNGHAADFEKCQRGPLPLGV